MGSIQDYVKKFITIILDIHEIIEKDKPFYFINNLSWQAIIKLQRRKVQNLTDTMTIAM